MEDSPSSQAYPASPEQSQDGYRKDSNTPSSTPQPHTSSSSATHNNTSSSILNPRSCVTCRRRKVRCNKQYPCSNCLKAHTECIFPAPGRAARRPRKPPDGELLARLRRLEGVIHGLGMTVDGETSNVESASEAGKEPALPSPPNPLVNAQEQLKRKSLENDFGRLVVNEGRSRYVNNRFWASLSSEASNAYKIPRGFLCVADLKGILDESSEDEADLPSPTSTDAITTPSDHGFIFHFHSLAHELHSWHPPKEQIEELWRTYKEGCDPVIKIVHTPSMENQILSLSNNPAKAHRGMEAFLFATYFAAITTLAPDECQARFGESRETLTKRYKFATEQALARANFMITEELIVLHAFMIYLLCLRRHEDGRGIWGMCGIMGRVAISMGLHRDGSNFGLTPFETEIRRRTYWQIVLLDIRSSQDTGIEPIVISIPSDVKMPLNVNDEDIDPSMTVAPTPRIGVTDMTFCLLRFDMSKTLGKLFYSSDASLQEKERWVTECHEYLELNYFRYCDMSKSLDWCICTVAKLIMARQFLLLYHPMIRSLPPETLDRLFVTSLETLEFAIRLETERRMVKFGWLFKTYNQWHALAFVLSELTRRTKGPLVQRAWRAVNNTIQEFRQEYTDNSKRGHLWKPLEKLLYMARMSRERELAQEAKMVVQQQQQQQPSAPFMMNVPEAKDEDGGSSTFNPAVSTGLGKGMTGFDGTNIDEEPLIDNSVLSLPALEPTVSLRSNPVDDKYMADNVWSNNGPVQSTFFANTPMPFMEEGEMPVMDDASLQAQMGNPGGYGDWFNNWDMSAIDPNLGGVPNKDAAAQGADPVSQGLMCDPMVSGGDVSGMQMMDWEEVMKEFELESNKNMGPQWQKQPVIGGSWF